MDPEKYYVSQICLNGHVRTEHLQDASSSKDDYCPDCGAKTITVCPKCGYPIEGCLKDSCVISIGFNPAPKYCKSCGCPYPWTESAINSLKELIEEDENLQPELVSKLNNSIPDIIAETPKTNLATTRVKKVLNTAGKFTVDALRQFVIDFGCELAIKLIKL